MAKSIQIIQPHYELPREQRLAALERFWSAVDADPFAVILVEGLDDHHAELCDIAVFSALAKAMEHAKNLPTSSAIVIPKRVDEPAWGNTNAH
jgi:hypothetical protein